MTWQVNIAAASPADDSKMKGLWQYLQGWRGSAQRTSVEKVGVVNLGLQLGKAYLRAVSGHQDEHVLTLCIVSAA
jgi:hypothetical protein